MSHIATGIVQRRKVGSPTRKAVLMFMAGCASDDGTGVWTSKQNMADDLEMGKRTVQVCIDDLEADGLISEVGRRSCRNGFTVEYRINLDAVQALESTREDAPTRAAPAPLATRAGDAPVQDVHPTRAAPAPQDVQLLHPNLPRTIHEPSKRTPIVPKPSKSEFEDFWAICPKKVGKGAAEASYTKARRKAEAHTISEAMARYAESRNGQDHQYTVHPATWLNQQRWTDETPKSGDDFYDQVSQMLRGQDGLPNPNAPDHRSLEHFPAPLQAPRTSGR